MEETKKCNRCGKILPVTEFHWKVKGVRRFAQCKACRKKECAEFYKTHKDYYAKKNREWYKKK